MDAFAAVVRLNSNAAVALLGLREDWSADVPEPNCTSFEDSMSVQSRLYDEAQAIAVFEHVRNIETGAFGLSADEARAFGDRIGEPLGDERALVVTIRAERPDHDAEGDFSRLILEPVFEFVGGRRERVGAAVAIGVRRVDRRQVPATGDVVDIYELDVGSLLGRMVP